MMMNTNDENHETKHKVTKRANTTTKPNKYNILRNKKPTNKRI